MGLANYHLQKEKVFCLPPIITELSENIQIQSRINSFFKRFNVKECLKEARIKKLSGHPIVAVVQFLVLLVFTQKNFYAFLHSNQPKEFAKDVIYRFLNNPLYDWRRFLLKLGAGVVNNFLNPLTKPERVKALILTILYTAATAARRSNCWPGFLTTSPAVMCGVSVN